MCGFTGILSADPRVVPDAEQLAAMALAIEHRGPDDQVLERRPGVGLAFRRLSILDLEGGRQPFVREGGRLIVCVNGELYNHAELRTELEAKGHIFETRSDCEVVPALYREYGDDFAKRLIGMFAFCVIDLAGERPRVLIGRDRLGIKPMYWAAIEHGVLFGSEPKALLASGWVGRELRPESLLDYLVQGYVGGPNAAFGGMQRLAPGHTVAFGDGSGEPVERAYWRMPTEASHERATGDEILALLDEVTQDRMEADVPLGAFLSGGIDSNAVVDSMTRAATEPVVACSVGFHERSHSELEVAKGSAAALGLTHHTAILESDPAPALETLPWLFDEPHADPSCVPTWLVSRMAREHVTVALSGDGGDETFAGYRRYVHDLAENRLRSAIGGPGRRVAAGLGAIYPKLDWAPRFLRGQTFLRNLGRDPARAYWGSVTQASRSQALALLAPDVRARIGGHDPFHRFETFYKRPSASDPLYRAQYADIHTYLTDQILAKVDRASMGVSLEVRVPLLDHRFVERFAGLPPGAKVAGGRGKVALREALRGRLRAEVLDGAKRGFDTPLQAWIRGPLAPVIEESLASLPPAWFDVAACQRLLDEHRSGRHDRSKLLWSLFVLDRWRRRHAVESLVA